MMKLIFFDVDGVLNAHDKHRHPNGYCGIDPQCVYRLNRIVASTNALLVISSAWRYLLHASMSLDGFHHMMKTYGLEPLVQIQGITARDEVIPNRGDQIACYLAETSRMYRVRSWVALDDGSDKAPHPPATMPLTESLERSCGERWVRVDGSVGLTDADADRAIDILCCEGGPG